VRVGVVANLEDPEGGFVEERLGALGASFVRRWRTEPSRLVELEREVDIIVLLGSDWSVYDAAFATEIDAERALVARATEAGCPTLGICFGAQLVASSLGLYVERAPRGEIGWVDIESDRPDLFGSGPWFSFHLDRWQPTSTHPGCAKSGLASQAIAYRRTLGVQFHPEVTAAVIERWLRESPRDVAAAGGDVDAVLDATAAHIADAQRRCYDLVDAFIDRIAGSPLTLDTDRGARAE
jgi:GMP synthase-like glutamine amidotransferase